MTYSSSPNSGQSLGQTRDQIRTNSDLLKASLAVDHVDLGSANVGKHKFSHYIDQGSDPTTAANELAVYSKAVAGVSRLFFRSESNGTTVQMTAGDPSQATFAALVAYGTPPAGWTQVGGWTFLPGNMLMQYGFYAKAGATGSSGQIQFPVTWASGAFDIQLTIYRNSGNQTISLDSSIPPTTTTFNFLTSSSGSDGIQWFAIGR